MITPRLCVHIAIRKIQEVEGSKGWREIWLSTDKGRLARRQKDARIRLALSQRIDLAHKVVEAVERDFITSIEDVETVSWCALDGGCAQHFI